MMWKSCVKTHASGKFLPLPPPPPPSCCYLKLPLLCIRLMLLVQKSNSFWYLERLRAPGLLPADGTQVSWKCYCPEGRKSRNACKHSVAFSLLEGSIKIPDAYSIAHIGSAKKRGAPKKAKANQSLVRETSIINI